MEIVIGVQHMGRELRLEVEEKAKDIRKAVDDAVDKERKMIWVTDKRGRQIGVPTEKLAYVEIAAEKSDRAVGFAVGERT